MGFIKKNIKLFVGILIGMLMSGGVVFAATLMNANEVAYIPSDNGWNVNDVKSALDQLYNKAFPECEYTVGTTWTFDYAGLAQDFSVPCDGSYKIELWGAQGGGNTTRGFGAYTKGVIGLNTNEKLYIYVGNKPDLKDNNYNGGGNANNSYYPTYDGGGATDVRYFSQTPSGADLAWDSFNGLKARIMVAAGAGGYGTYNERQGASGGGLVGYDAEGYATGGTQTAGGSKGNAGGHNGTFGKGGDGELTYGGGAGGGGYYGGGGNGNSYSVWEGAGGSSFISGHGGCNAIAENSTSDNIIHRNTSDHFSGKIFTETVMIDGNGYSWTTEKAAQADGMPTHDGSSTMTGNAGNGFARITLVSLN